MNKQCLNRFKQLMPKIKSFYGGESVGFFLSRLNQTKDKALNNSILKSKGKTAQIDHVVVSDYGAFAIETKNYKGWIFENEYNEYGKQIIYKIKLYNPIKAIYTKIKERNDKIKKGICPKCGDRLVVRDGRYKSCINYPKCKFIIK